MSTSRKRLPPLQNLEAFEAAARHLSFTKAGEEVNLSQSAVSRQIKHLEESLGALLFTRTHKHLELTRAGKTLAQGIERSLAELRRTVETIESDHGVTVTISASMAMASFWLLPGIAEFKSQYPEIKVKVIAGDGDDYLALQNNETDFTLLYDHGQRTGYSSTGLFEETIFPACAPSYLQGRTIDDPSSLVREKLIDFEVKHLRTVKGWPDWLVRAGLDSRGVHYSMSVSNYDLACRAASAGQGIILMWAYVAPLTDFSNGILIRPVQEVVKTGRMEYLVHENSLESSEVHMTFKSWLLEYAERTRQNIEEFFAIKPGRQH